MQGAQIPERGELLPAYWSLPAGVHAGNPRHSMLRSLGTPFAYAKDTFAQRKSLGKEVNANGGSTEVHGFLQPGRGG